jgi:winged helix DNA-binding protein
MTTKPATTKPSASAALTWAGVTARRMARHWLATPAADLDPAGVAAAMCGAHAQLLTAAELSIGRRIAGATRGRVQAALWQQRTLVKTFGPRGTVHLLPAADLPMWTGALSAPAVGGTALRDLVTRYLHAYGPATPQHFARWLGVWPRYAAGLFGQLAGELDCVELDGEPGWTVAGDTATPRHRPNRTAGCACCPTSIRTSSRVSHGPAVPGRGRRPRAHPVGPGRELPGTARRRSGRRRVASAALGPQAGHHRRTTARADRIATPAARRRSRARRRGHGGGAHPDAGHRVSRPARMSSRPA